MRPSFQSFGDNEFVSGCRRYNQPPFKNGALERKDSTKGLTPLRLIHKLNGIDGEESHKSTAHFGCRW
jgi:hypothetical protein